MSTFLPAWVLTTRLAQTSSQMQVHVVHKARKPGTCQKCGFEIRPGYPYRWAKGRYTAKKVRCLDPKCYFRNSDLASSDKVSRSWLAQETAEDAIAAWDGQDTDDLDQILTVCAEEIREVAEEYRESAENIRASFQDSPTADECDEKADSLEEWADAMDSPDFEDKDETPPTSCLVSALCS